MSDHAAIRSEERGVALVSGASGFIGGRLVEALARGGRRLALLCRPASARRLGRRLERLPPELPRPRLVPGDLTRDGLGLEDHDAAWLRAEVGEVFHLAAVYDLFLDQEQLWPANVDGTRRLLELAGGWPRLRRFHHVSSMAVAGDFSGLFGEDDLDVGQGFPHAYGRTKFEAERLVRGSGLAWTIYRPGAVVGDSQTGEIDKLDGAYYAIAALNRLRRLPGARRWPMIVPRGDEHLFHLVPVDFVVAALTWLAARADGAGRTHHLTDPDPASFRRFYLALLREMGFKGPTIERPVQRLVRLLMRPRLWPLVRRAGRALGVPAELLPHLLYAVRYDTSRTEAELAAGGIRCPRILDYLPVLVRTFEQRLA